MLTIRDLTGKEEALMDYKDITRKRRVNGEYSLSFLLLKTERNAHSFDMVEDETIVAYDGDEYRIKQIEERLVGTTPVKQVRADHAFFDIIDVYQYGKLTDGTKTITQALQHALTGTGYTFSVVDTFASQYFENFGDDNALALFGTILERYQAEYTLVGTDVRVHRQIGDASDFQFRYRHNVKTFAKTVKTDGLSTYIKGYGKQNDDGTYAATAEYTSQMADVYGVRHAKPIRDDSFTDSAALLDYLKMQIQDTPEVSITVDFADMRKAGYPYEVPGYGDTVYLIYEPLSVDMTTRIFEIVDYPESDKSPQVTLANFREQFANVVFRHTKNEIEKIYDPNSGKVRYNVLDEAVRTATESLQSAQTELEFNNGIIAREKTDPNRLVLLNSAGLGVSTSGGSTFKTAMTADGMVADVITAGTLDTALARIEGANGSIYMDGNEFRSMSASDINKYVSIQPGLLQIAKGAIKIERPDGYTWIEDGVPNFEFAVSETDPPYRNETLVVPHTMGWLKTTETTPTDFNYYSVKKSGRYLKVYVLAGLSQANLGNGAVEIHDSQGVLAQKIFTNNFADFNANGHTLTVDLGAPDGLTFAFYLRFYSGRSDNFAAIRKMRIWIEG